MAAIDLIVLGMLHKDSMSAYDLQKLVEYRNISKWVKISTPSIYKKVLQLEVTSHIEKEGKMPEKAVYALTDAGIDEFERLMFEISAKPISILLDFNAVIVNLEHLSKKNQQKCLAQIEDNVKALKSSIEENVLQKEKNTEIPEAGKAVLRQQLALAEAVETWIAALKSDFAARSDRRRDGN